MNIELGAPAGFVKKDAQVLMAELAAEQIAAEQKAKQKKKVDPWTLKAVCGLFDALQQRRRKARHQQKNARQPQPTDRPISSSPPAPPSATALPPLQEPLEVKWLDSTEKEEQEFIESWVKSYIALSMAQRPQQQVQHVQLPLPEDEAGLSEAEKKRLLRQRLMAAIKVLQGDLEDEDQERRKENEREREHEKEQEKVATKEEDDDEDPWSCDSIDGGEEETSWVKSASGLLRDYFNKTSQLEDHNATPGDNNDDKDGTKKQTWTKRWELSLKETETQSAKAGEECISLFRELKAIKKSQEK